MTELEARALHTACRRRGWHVVYYHHNRGRDYIVVGHDPARGWRLLRSMAELEASEA